MNCCFVYICSFVLFYMKIDEIDEEGGRKEFEKGKVNGKYKMLII